MYGTYSHTEFDPIKCYEELRFNILGDPFYTSRGRYLLENQGMFCWLNSVGLLNAQLSSQTPAIDMDSLKSFSIVESMEMSQNSLSVLLAEVILNIYPEVIYV